MNKKFRFWVVAVLTLTILAGVVLPEAFLQSIEVQAAETQSFVPAVVPGEFKNILSRAEGENEESSGGWRYVLLKPENYAIITGYDGETEEKLVIPDLLGNADVVGINDEALYSLSGVREVEIPGNVMAVGKKALPAGCTVYSTDGSYAKTWARKNSYAFVSISEIQFNEGVVDFTGIRPEKFCPCKRDRSLAS